MIIKTYTQNATTRGHALDAPGRLDEMIKKELGTDIMVYNIIDFVLEYPHLNEYIHERIVIYDIKKTK